MADTTLLLLHTAITVAIVVGLITYLCREESGYITGATYDVNGGAHIH
jgi:hypothetical protein